MPHSDRPELGLDGLSDRFCDSMGWKANRPDFRELDVGSPVSPLRTRQSGLSAATTTSSSCSSSGSVSGRTVPDPLPRRSPSGQNSHSCSSENSLTAGSGRTIGKFGSGPEGSESLSTQPTGYSGQSSVDSPALNVLPLAISVHPAGSLRVVRPQLGLPGRTFWAQARVITDMGA